MEYIVMRHFFCFFFSWLFAYYLIPLVAKAALCFGILDCPDGRVKVHSAPVPYLGGIAVFSAFIATLSVAYPFENKVLWLLLGSTFLLFVGLIDDLKALSPHQKFFGQFIAVLCFFKGGFSLKAHFFSTTLNCFLSGFWMLSVINAFNLIDVMDGLSSLTALGIAVSYFGIALFFQQYTVSLLLTAFIGALFAFFLYNKPPASIYLGDAGSMFLGGFLAAIPLLFSWSKQSLDAYYAAVVVTAIPLLELFFLVMIRTSLGIPFYSASPHHFSIYLQKKNWSKKKILLFILLMQLIASTGAFLFLSKIISLCLLILSGVAYFLVWCFFVFSK